MNTEQKIKIAKILSWILCGLRGFFGFGTRVTTIRNGIVWDLNLQEGFDLCIYIAGCIEKETFLALMRTIRPGDVVLDIGANMGGHLLPIASKVQTNGHVYAFEASEHAYKRQRRNIDLNPQLAKRISSYHVMLMEKTNCEKPLGIYSSWPLIKIKGASIHPVHEGQMHDLGKAGTQSIDDWNKNEKLKRIDLIKIDVDGFEIPVFRGSVETIRKFKPKIIMELAPYIHQENGYRFSELLEMIGEFGYRMETLRGQKLPLNMDIANQITKKGSINVMLFPE